MSVASKLKNHDKYSSIYLTPDLTPSQRKVAFELRMEKRRREKDGEADLAIRKGRIVKLPVKVGVGDHNYAPAGNPPPNGGRRDSFH